MRGCGTAGAMTAEELLRDAVAGGEAAGLSDEDARLLTAAASDAQAFTVVYRRWQGPLYRYTLHMSGSESLAEDITQEVFVSLAQNGDRFDPSKGRFSSYVFAIARNLVRRRLRREGLYASLVRREERRDAAIDVATMAAGEAPSFAEIDVHADPASTPEQVLDRREAIAQVRRAVCALPVGFREVVVLCDLQELSYVEAAAIIGCPVGTVRSRLHRGRQLLAERLRPVAMAKSEGNAGNGR